MQIDGKSAIVTGAADGIGFCIVRELLRNGAKAVAILDIDSGKGEKAVVQLKGEFGEKRVLFFQCDVGNGDEFKESFGKAVKALGDLDIFVNNAGIMDDAEWEPMINVNYCGTIRGTLLAIHQMGTYKGGKGGTIVNMSSVAGLSSGTPIAPIYGGSGHAIVGFTQALQKFHEKTDIRFLTICPGLTTTSLAATFMASKEHAIDLLDDEMAAQEMIGMQEQPPEHVATAVMELIEKGENGDVYVVENNLPAYAIKIPDYPSLKV